MRNLRLLVLALTVLLLLPTPGHAGAYWSLMKRGTLAADDNNYDEAVKLFSQAIEIDAKSPYGYLARGLAYYSLKKSPEALVDFDQALKIKPDLESASCARGVIYAEQGNYAEAIKNYESATRSGFRAKGTTVLAANNVAWIYATCPVAEFRNGKRAVKQAKSAWDLGQGQPTYMTDTLAAAYAEAGDFAEAVKWEQAYLALPDLSKDDVAGAQKRLALYQAGRPYHMGK